MDTDLIDFPPPGAAIARVADKTKRHADDVRQNKGYTNTGRIDTYMLATHARGLGERRTLPAKESGSYTFRFNAVVGQRRTDMTTLSLPPNAKKARTEEASAMNTFQRLESKELLHVSCNEFLRSVIGGA